MTAHEEKAEDKNEGKEDHMPVSPPDTDIAAANASVTLVERLAEKLGGRASVTAVYGEPVTADGITVIPVAKVGFGFGGGAGRTAEGVKVGDGGGGGGGVEAKPVGYIEIKDGVTAYRPIRTGWGTWGQIGLPLAALVLGIALPKAVQALRRRR